MSDLQDVIASTAIKAMNEGYSRGVMAEQERIIKLLEDELWHHIVPRTQIVLAGGLYQGRKKHHDEDCIGCRQIALIKGEQK